MSGAIAVFVKTPGLSPVKTRLAATLGQTTAEDFHIAAAEAVVSVMQELTTLADVHCYYAVAEQVAIDHHHWQDQPCIWQGEGGLGERMAYIYQTLLQKHDYVILVGADIPQMTSLELLKSCNCLSLQHQAQFAFAPSEDGGFWLLGGNCHIPLNIWTDVIYSEANTGSQFLKEIQTLGDVKTLACLRDVDEVQDLPSLKEALLKLSSPTSKQLKLLQYLASLAIN